MKDLNANIMGLPSSISEAPRFLLKVTTWSDGVFSGSEVRNISQLIIAFAVGIFDGYLSICTLNLSLAILL